MPAFFDPALDLRFERTVDVPAAFVWKAWTTPELLKQWFAPAPWKTVDCEIDLRPGGIFRTVMRSPGNYDMPNVGCYLEVVPARKLVWTNALGPGFRPQRPDSTCGEELHFFFTAIVEIESTATGTRYTATVLHGDEKARATHDAMGFEQGWGAAFDQLVGLSKKT